MKRKIMTCFLLLIGQSVMSQNIPPECKILFYNLPLNANIEELINSAKKLKNIREINTEKEGFAANLDSPIYISMKPRSAILNIQSGTALFDNYKFKTDKTIIVTMNYFYSSKKAAIKELEAIKQQINKNVQSFIISKEETDIKGIYGYECLLKKEVPLPVLRINLEKEDGYYSVEIEMTSEKV